MNTSTNKNSNNSVINEEIIDEIIAKKSCNHNHMGNNSNGGQAKVGGDIVVVPNDVFSPILLKKSNDLAHHNSPSPINTSTPISQHRKQTAHNNSYDMPTLNSTNDSNTSYSRKYASTDHSKTFNSSRRSNNSSLCLGDFINTSLKSNNKKSNTSGPSPNASVDKTKTFDRPTASNKQPVAVQTVVAAKPKRRVVPHTISKVTSGRNEFTSSSFRADNNLSNFMIEETEPGQESGRDFIRQQRDSISRDFLDEQVPYKGLHASVKDAIGDRPRETLPVDLGQITGQCQLERLARIYSLIIDMNLTTNILTEISFLVNLLNADVMDHPIAGADAKLFDLQALLKNFNNCVFFALETLMCQRRLLAALDATTIRVLLENERLVVLKQQLIDFLRSTHTNKLRLESNSGSAGEQFNKNNVFYQQESDTRDNFPSEQSFTAFRKQRDMFYSILRTWEERHLDSTFNFPQELGAKVKTLLKLMEHPINMAHLSKLFAAQLIISCNFDHSTSELRMALPNIDLTKLSKLRQRLDAPSLFSTQYQFPGNQAFFRDFIECTENNPIFIHQLKLCLINELIEMNNSSYETFNIEANGSGISNQDEIHEYMVRPEFLSTMRILAKFIGFIVAKPFNYHDFGNNVVDSTQIAIRNNLLVEFDVKSIVLKAICERKWIVTIPWLVQYLSMLDFVTLRLNYMKEVLYILYEFYINCAPHNTEKSTLCIPVASSFMLRLCLGWLFEQPAMPEEYFGYRQQRSNYSLLSNLKAIENAPAKTVARRQLSLTDEIRNPVIENLLSVACPFLADFRVSMMPSRVTKTISRSGRYRHITTKFSGDSSITQREKTVSLQAKLVEEFLNTQSLSVKKTVEFIVERTTSAVVKDFQVDHIIVAKRKVVGCVRQIKLSTVEAVVGDLHRIYSAELALLNRKWDEEMPKMINQRSGGAFDALLPKELPESIGRTCKNIAFQRTLTKVNDWRMANMNSIELFTKDVNEEAAKLMKFASKPATSNFTIFLDHYSSTDFFEWLQTLLHVASETPHLVVTSEVEKFLVATKACLGNQGFSHAMLRTASFMVLQLLLLIVCYRPELITAKFLDAFLDIFRMDKLRAFTCLPKKCTTKEEVGNVQLKIASSDHIFSNVMSPRYIQMLRNSEACSYQKFAEILVQLINSQFIDLTNLNDQLGVLMGERWPEAVNLKISTMYQHILDKCLINGCESSIVNHLTDLTIES